MKIAYITKHLSGKAVMVMTFVYFLHQILHTNLPLYKTSSLYPLLVQFQHFYSWITIALANIIPDITIKFYSCFN